MSSDAKGMLEVNRELILQAARAALQEGAESKDPLVVISAATWGRGNNHSRLAALKEWQRFSGYNSSVVALPPPRVAALFIDPPQSPPANSFLAVGVGFGKTHWEWWTFDGSENLPELF